MMELYDLLESPADTCHNGAFASPYYEMLPINTLTETPCKYSLCF